MLSEWDGGPADVLLNKLLGALAKEELWLDELPDIQSLATGGSAEDCKTKMEVVEQLMAEAEMHRDGCEETRDTIAELFEKCTPPIKGEMLSTLLTKMNWRYNAIHNRMKFFIIGCRNANIVLEGAIFAGQYLEEVHSMIDSMKELRSIISSAPYEYDRTSFAPILRDHHRSLARFEEFKTTIESLSEKASNSGNIQFNRFTGERISSAAINKNSREINRAIEACGDRLEREFERLEKVVRHKTEKIIQSHVNVGSRLPGYQIPVSLLSLIDSQIAKESGWMNNNEHRLCFRDFNSFVHSCLRDQNGMLRIVEVREKFQNEYSLKFGKKLPLMKALCSTTEMLCQLPKDNRIDESLRHRIEDFSNQFEIFWTTFEKRKEEVLEFERVVNAVKFVILSKTLEEDFDEAINELSSLQANMEENAVIRSNRDARLVMELLQMKASKAGVDMTGVEKFAVYRNLMDKTELTPHEQQVENIVFECNLRNVQETFVNRLREKFPGIYCIDANRRNDALQQILNKLKIKADQFLELNSEVASRKRMSETAVHEEVSGTGLNLSLREKRARQD